MVNIWPNNCKAAVSLTFDDGMDVHLDRVIPMLESYDLRGTFYVLPQRDDWRERLEQWKPAAEAGHEIGNHSVSHMCPAALWGREPKDTDLERMTLQQVEADILLAEERLNQVFPGVERSYCYPCYSMFVGAGAGHQSYVPVVAKHFPAARSTGEFGYNYPHVCDMHTLFSWRGEGATAAELIGKVEMAIARGTWDIFVFHALDKGPLGTNSYHFDQFLSYLARRKDAVWVAPLIDVAKTVIKWRKEG
jgi:hypothetical protein